MSSSEHLPADPQEPTSFLVAADPTVRITVYDTTRTALGRAEGTLQLALRPGLYSVQFERGSNVHHEIVDHEADTSLTYDGPALQSPVPFLAADTSRNYYTSAVKTLSETEPRTSLGPAPHTSRLLVFLRRATRDGTPRRLPSEPLTIHDADGHRLDAITDKHANQDTGHVAYGCRVAPGTYRLRGARSQRDVAIVVPAGRAALVFIEDTGLVRLADLRLALVPVGARFDPASPIWSAMENVLAVLGTRDRALPLAARRLLPDAIEQDLCFGVACAHILWRSGDRGFARVMQDLEKYRDEIPDVEILDRLTMADGSPRESPAELPDTPPLLRASVALAMTRPEFDPGTLSAHSAFAHAARTSRHDSVWCTWSARTWDQRWIEPAVERLRREPPYDATSIGRQLALATETVEQALVAIDAATPAASRSARRRLPLATETVEQAAPAIDATTPVASGSALASPVLVVPGYTLDEMLGRGARSTVYRATRLADRRAVALKLVPVPGGADGCEHALKRLERCKPADQPGLVTATRRGALPGHTGIWLEMELCRHSVLDLLSERDAPLPLPEAHRVVLDALAILARFHETTEHGDLHPANILVREDGSVALAGPDLAARRALPAELGWTTDALKFAAPELLRSAAERPSPASDVWAMAATYFFMLTLEYPRDEFAGQTELEAALDNKFDPIGKRIADHRAAWAADLPPDLVQCLDGVLSQEAHHRAAAGARRGRPRWLRGGGRRPTAAAFRKQLAKIDPSKPSPKEPWLRRLLRALRALLEKGLLEIKKVLEQGLKRPPLFAACGAAASAIIVLLLWLSSHTSTSMCEQRIASDDWTLGVEVCLAGYNATGDEQYLVWAGKGYLQLDNLDKADAIAERLRTGAPEHTAAGKFVTGARYVDGLALQSEVELQRGRIADAMAHAMHARVLHVLDGNQRGQAGDLVLLSRAAWQAGDFSGALNAADQALQLTRRVGDKHSKVAASLARAEALRQLGDRDRAIATLSDARAAAAGPCARASLQLALALSSMDAGHSALARNELDELAKPDRACESSALSSSVLLTQAWLQRWTDPAAARARLDELAAARHEPGEALLLRAYLAADRGLTDEAEQYLERAAGASNPGADLGWKIAQAMGELAELRAGPAGDVLAEAHYRRAAAMITSSRGITSARSADFLASHRPVYEELIALLARNGRWRDALAVVLELDTNDMLQATTDYIALASRDAGGTPEDSDGARESRDRATGLYRAPRVVDAPSPTAAPASPVSVDDLLSAWRSRDLVIVIAAGHREIGPDHERTYRLHVAHGEVTGRDIAAADEIRQAANALYYKPDSPKTRDSAQTLGRAIVPSDGSTETLYVLASGPLGRVPLAALRDSQGSLVIGGRPLVRVLALRATGPESRGAGPAVVIADPRGDLQGAADEGSVVAKLLGPGAQLSGSNTGVAATRARLLTASDARLLHIAAHGAPGGSPSLALADNSTLDASEIAEHHIAPRIAVLTVPASAAAVDEQGSGSLAAELLRAGTATVIAPDRNIGDTASVALIQAFYDQPNWSTDPARALARAQSSLAAEPDTGEAASRLWAVFCVLGRPPEVPHVPPG